MKKFTFCVVFALCNVLLSAQDLTLKVDVTPGNLKDAMTEEQMETVTNLILTGSLNDDDFSILRNNMPRLRDLDMESLEVETIPYKAFYDSYIPSIVLPKGLMYIGDSAFYSVGNLRLTFTGNFPILGNDVFAEDYDINYEISLNNPNLRIIDGSVYSSDESTFYLSTRLMEGYPIKDGTKTIGGHAFEGCHIRANCINIPASVNYIKEYAFSNIRKDVPTCGGGSSDIYYSCYCLIPPTLDEHVFYKENIGDCDLTVPEESLDLYKSASQWDQFRSIEAFSSEPPRNIKSEKKSSLIIENEDGVFKINAEYPISLIELINMEGTVFYSEEPCTERFSFNLSGFTNSIFILRVTYLDGQVEVVKLKR